jgi:hypothetical protein
MFKVGDKIVCISNEEDWRCGISHQYFTIGKIYTVVPSDKKEILFIKNNNGWIQVFTEDRFVPYNYRKEKVEKICSKLGI